MLRRWLLALANSSTSRNLIASLEQADRPAPHSLRVLTYHRIAEPAQLPDRSPAAMVMPEEFDLHMRFIKEQYCAVSMKQVLDGIQAGKTLPDRSVLITFDDATRDFAENALPILQRYQLPVTLFVPTAYPGHLERAFWWDRLYSALQPGRSAVAVQTPAGPLPLGTVSQRKKAFRVLRSYVKSLPHHQAMAWIDQFCRESGLPGLQGDVLSWDELRQVVREGVSLGAHTRTHPLMSQVSEEEAKEEIAGSFNDLKREIGDVLPIFAYPSGGYTQAVTTILRREGVELAFTTDRGHNHLQATDHLRLKRINVGPGTSLSLLRLQLLGVWFSLLGIGRRDAISLPNPDQSKRTSFRNG
jgi:peptidoglycan/xylan/chitin deacetylase (PgdA/CDA1 family)